MVSIALARRDSEPAHLAEVAVLGDSLLHRRGSGQHVRMRKVGHRVAARLIQEQDAFAVGNPLVGEPNPHPAPQRLGEQQPWRQRL